MNSLYNTDFFKMINTMSQLTKGFDSAVVTAPILHSLLPDAVYNYCKASPTQLMKGLEIFHKSIGFDASIPGIIVASKQMTKSWQSITGINNITDLSAKMAVQNFAGILTQYSQAQMPDVISNLSKSLEILAQYYEKGASKPNDHQDISETSEVQTYELEKDVQTIISDIAEDKNWQQTLNDRIVFWEKENPIYARVLAFLIGIVLQMIITSALGSITTSIRNLVMRKQASSKAEVTMVIPQGDQILILSADKPYYYKVYYSDPDGNEFEGYVSKRMLNHTASPSNATPSSR